jgi:hypothetical protein
MFGIQVMELRGHRSQAAGLNGRWLFGSVVYNNKMWVIGGSSISGNQNDVWNSSDGQTWTSVALTTAFSARSEFGCIVYNNRMWVIAGGNNVSGYLNDIWSSSDGITWTQATASAGFPVRAQMGCIVYNNKMWVIAGGSFDPADVYYNDVWYSSDGATWTESTPAAAFNTRYYLGSLVYNNKMWVIAGGDQSDLYMNDVWWSQ